MSAVCEPKARAVVCPICQYIALYCNEFYYRAMHFSAKRGIAIACRLSVRPSVRL